MTVSLQEVRTQRDRRTGGEQHLQAKEGQGWPHPPEAGRATGDPPLQSLHFRSLVSKTVRDGMRVAFSHPPGW